MPLSYTNDDVQTSYTHTHTRTQTAVRQQSTNVGRRIIWDAQCVVVFRRIFSYQHPKYNELRLRISISREICDCARTFCVAVSVYGVYSTTHSDCFFFLSSFQFVSVAAVIVYDD